MVWKPGRLLGVILVWTTATMTMLWLVFIRCLMDGASYEWNATWLGFSFCGKGVGGDYWLMTLVTLFGVSVIYLGWRGASQPFHGLLLLWHASFASDLFYKALESHLQQPTAGSSSMQHITLTWPPPVLAGAFALLALLWVVRDLGRFEPRRAPEWNGRNTSLLALTIGLVPLVFVLLHFGEPQGTSDKLGLALAAVQWALMSLAFFPWAPSRRFSTAEAS